RVAVSQHAVPPALEDVRRTIEALHIELEIIGREEAVGIDASSRRAAAAERLSAEETRRAELEERWQQERELVDRILAIRAELRRGGEHVEGTGSELERAAAAHASVEPRVEQAVAPKDRAGLLAELSALHGKLAALQGESPLIFSSVDEHAVASVVQDW